MYPYHALQQCKEITEAFPETLEAQSAKRKDLREELVFTIDSPSAQALDDAISMAEVAPGVYRVDIHISDVASLIKADSPMDREALKRAESTYVLNTFHMPMLPRELNSGICSLHQDQNRLAVTLSLEINDDGIANFESAAYHLSIIKNQVRLSYTSAD